MPIRDEQVSTQCAVSASGSILSGTGAWQSGKLPSLIIAAFIVIIYQVHHLWCDWVSHTMPTMTTVFTGLCVLWEIRAGGHKFLRILNELKKKKVAQIRRFVAGPSPRRPWFDLLFVRVRFVVDKAEQGPVFLRVLLLYTLSIIPPLLHALASPQ